MNDSPSARHLLEAVARTLTEQVLPETSGGTAHAVRVSANLCRIVSRELAAQDDSESHLGIAAALNIEAYGDETNHGHGGGGGGGDNSATGDDRRLAVALDERLKQPDPVFEQAIGDLLYQDVCRRVDIAKPGYRDLGGG